MDEPRDALPRVGLVLDVELDEACMACPFEYHRAKTGEKLCMAKDARVIGDDDVDGAPTWCPLHDGSVLVRGITDA